MRQGEAVCGYFLVQIIKKFSVLLLFYLDLPATEKNKHDCFGHLDSRTNKNSVYSPARNFLRKAVLLTEKV